VVVPVPDLSYTGRRGVTVHLTPDEATERATAGQGEAEAPALADAWEATRRRLTLARSLQARLDAGEARTRKELAERVKMSTSRMAQLLGLLRLAPSILETIEGDRSATVALGDDALRVIERVEDHDEQVQAFKNALATVQRRGRRPLGFKHLLERARRYQDMLEAEPDLTLRAVGKREGVSGMRVGQILQLLCLAPEILAAIDVPGEKLPVGITEESIRPIARIKEHREQVAAFRALVTGSRAR